MRSPCVAAEGVNVHTLAVSQTDLSQTYAVVLDVNVLWKLILEFPALKENK